MDHHQWYPRPPAPLHPQPMPPPLANNICPVCSISHFPFCPSPSYPHPNPRFPPRPDYYPRPVFDARPWQDSNPNFNRQNPVQPAYDYYGSGNGYASECDRNLNNKRMRVDESYQLVSSDDERRLKLIRDHGGGFGNAPNVGNHVPHDGYSIYGNHWHSCDPPNNQAPGLPLPRPPQHGWPYQNYNNMGQPPLPTSPPPPLPLDPPPPPQHPSHFNAYPSAPPPKTSLFPVPVSVPTSYQPITHASAGFISKESQQPPRQLSPEKPKFVNVLHLFKQPHRATRPDHFVVILRGLPGSGKSYLAKMLRDLEVENGGNAPRIHSMDDYFMNEVEKVEDEDVSKSSSSFRSKKPVTKKVMEYCYEPEMEEAYRSSMLKAFKRTLEDGSFTFVIVDDRNLRVADFAQFWAIGKRSGYEVYILDATYKDPAGCAARNVHGFSLDQIKEMAAQWEEAPSLYLQLDVKSLFHGDNLKESEIREVVMDMEDDDSEEGRSTEQEREQNKVALLPTGDEAPADSLNSEKRWNAEGDHSAEVIKDLGRSKWSGDVDEDDSERSEVLKGRLNALSGLIKVYSKEGKSVHWSDKVGDTGFSISAAKKATVSSLVIGPGAGYNSKSNPLPEEESLPSNSSIGKSKNQGIFQEQLRAERESFKAVFDRRRHRIGGIDLEDD